MFRKTTSCFSTVRCPKADTCRIPNCLFSHKSPPPLPDLKRPITTEAPSSVAKRLRVSSEPSLEQIPADLKNGISGQPLATTTEEDLKTWTPKQLNTVGAPATVQQRMRYIAAIINAYIQNNVPLPRKTAVEHEYQIARASSRYTYNPKMKQFIQRAKMNATMYFKPDRGNTKTMTKEETYAAVKSLVHNVEKLKRNGYITEIPYDDGSLVTDGQKCNRCGNDFLLSEINREISCQFHERKKRIENNDRYWECCSQVVGESQGCKQSKHHVFKSQDPTELHKLIPFRKTPPPKEPGMMNIVGLDCEMGYTSKGMELIRLTVMDFYTGKVLYDEVVRPSGTILDLNTTWSGVSSIPDDALNLDQMLSVVLGGLINNETIIVGHGLENDLITMRIVHNQVVDTAVLFPKSLDRKYALKDLAFQFLDRKIQSGEHSSEEDSLAAIDIIKTHISRTDHK
ncbi:RNA exonuclease 3 [Cyberlindnera fabianii]|uniref:RNA exonuclease 3 n=1 Tax=Cyberlindnera fabianii TaxID=36022 RepID=A0A1V2L7Y0_CYBFA|nr:RNA exonuclease 3 [Cyberlindnera fabianii]